MVSAGTCDQTGHACDSNAERFESRGPETKGAVGIEK